MRRLRGTNMYTGGFEGFGVYTEGFKGLEGFSVDKIVKEDGCLKLRNCMVEDWCRKTAGVSGGCSEADAAN